MPRLVVRTARARLTRVRQVTRRRWLLVLVRRQRLVVRRHGLVVLLVLVRRRWVLVLHRPGLCHSERRARRLLRRPQLERAWLLRHRRIHHTRPKVNRRA